MKKTGRILLLLLVLLLTGCAGVEPEHRAFPLVTSIDYDGSELQVIYGMANLPEQTGQLKSTGEEPSLVQVFAGETMEQVLKSYNSSQEYFLDQGHIQVIVMGEGLLNDKKKLMEVLTYLEQEPIIADSIFLFACAEPKSLMEVNGNTVESLSEYLTGIYKNRVVPREEEAVTLQEMLNAWHNEGQFLTLPAVTLKDGRPKIPSLDD